MTEKKQEWELLPSLFIGKMNSYLQVKTFTGPEKEVDLLRGWKPMSCKGQVQQRKARLKNQSILSEDQRKNLAQGKAKSPVEASQASKSKNPPQQVPQKGQENPKEQSEGQAKGKGKGKVQVEQASTTELQNYKERKDSHGQCVQYGKNPDGIKNQG
ncbi:hypothetical protein O181_130311 [Austropuccinia psidii MF-1]|uniref:Uncharacterized protein n=1 Tax=Austropuccinia psidii MF-1 TaxID=1389203 RepID=A0A9Q3L1W5_9BASI|nr:hypothetical protein [Austropuccinia psidii MF-1]